MRRFPSELHRSMPWKDGGGTTVEIAIEPPGASLSDPFLWRLSMARVERDGPFSRFAGYDRTLLLLEGRGMALDFEGGPAEVLEAPLAPLAFSGDRSVAGRLLGGPCRDFNLITDRRRLRHRLEVIRVGPEGAPLPEAPLVLLFAPEGGVVLEGAGPEMAAGEAVAVAPEDGIRRARALRPGTPLVAAALEPA